MEDYINLVDTHSNEFVNKRLNVLNKNVLSKDLEYIEKKRKLEDLLSSISIDLNDITKGKLKEYTDLLYEVATFEVTKIYTFGFMDACQIRRKVE